MAGGAHNRLFWRHHFPWEAETSGIAAIGSVVRRLISLFSASGGRDMDLGNRVPSGREPLPGQQLVRLPLAGSFQDKYQDHVTLRSKVRHILGYDGPAFRPGCRGDLRVIDCPQAYLGDVDGVLAIGIAQQFGRGDRKHLIDQERRHARSASRSWAVLRLRSVIPRLRSIRSRTSPECSAA